MLADSAAAFFASRRAEPARQAPRAARTHDESSAIDTSGVRTLRARVFMLRRLSCCLHQKRKEHSRVSAPFVQEFLVLRACGLRVRWARVEAARRERERGD